LNRTSQKRCLLLFGSTDASAAGVKPIWGEFKILSAPAIGAKMSLLGPQWSSLWTASEQGQEPSLCQVLGQLFCLQMSMNMQGSPSSLNFGYVKDACRRMRGAICMHIRQRRRSYRHDDKKLPPSCTRIEGNSLSQARDASSFFFFLVYGTG
jgi:hypothetical protein